MKALSLFLAIGLLQIVFIVPLILFGLRAATVAVILSATVYTILCLRANQQERKRI
jgi:hypothetical protein